MISADRCRVLAALTTQFFLFGCAAVRDEGAPDIDLGAAVAVTIMTFNVENLFDNHDDVGKVDETYLPIGAKQNREHMDACNEIPVKRWRDDCLRLDWSDATLDHKLKVVADSIRQVNDGSGADVIALQEVENLQVLERLRKDHLADLGYLPGILVEGSDRRGIDVAFLSRLPLANLPILHPLDVPQFAERQGDTRGVLQADFRLPNGTILTGFSVHFPAPFHPTEMRVAAYEHLNQLRNALPDNHHAFAAGDFNTTSSEDAEKHLLDKYARPTWAVAQDIGCGACKGTHYYARDDSWSFLDTILFAAARSEKTTAQIRADSVRIANRNPAQVSSIGSPERFNAAERSGVSDHWPMIATVEVMQKQ
jgi:endonuclease/exonuclease/phosphatase family metal-dependent hydrolase